jgi:hypothetical protein
MARKIKSPTRTITNRGPIPRFIGYCPHTKSTTSYLPFDSIACLVVGIYLNWLITTARLEFEAEEIKATFEGVEIRAIPDYRTTDVDGEIGLDEAKYDEDALPPELKEQLDLRRRYFASVGRRYNVHSRVALEANGFARSLFLLRRYERLEYSDAVKANAVRKLASTTPKTLTEWRAAARSHAISLPLVYHLLYHHALPFTPEAFRHEQVALCQDW